MAFDGITTAALSKELSDHLTGGRIFRIIQPESDALLVTIKPEIERGGGQVKLLLSADPSLPLVYLTDESPLAPAQAPSFCMLLRKYIQNGKITRIWQPGLERILRFDITHRSEMGDLLTYTLVVELMGKHSNIMLLDENEVILDSIRHVSQMVSSVREVLPGRPYFVPKVQNKTDPLSVTKEAFFSLLLAAGTPASGFLVRAFTGFSTLASEEVTFKSHISQDRSAAAFTEEEKEAFWSSFSALMSDIRAGIFHPAIYYRLGQADALSQGEPVDFSCMELSMYRDLPKKNYTEVSKLLSDFYAQKNAVTRIRQKSSDLRHVVTTILERDVHKYDLQMKQLKDTKKRDKYRLYGELLNAYGYSIGEGVSSAELENYYTGETVKVPLDPTKTPQQNAKRYFDRYTKLKRTEEALTVLTKEVKAEIDELESIKTALDLSLTEGDLAQIRTEMEQAGFVKKQKEQRGKHQRIPESKPLHFVSSDGFDIYVGKNNIQNDALTFHFALPTDIWFHANDVPGSHVILRTGGKAFDTIPDRAFEEAAMCAAYYSRGREAGRVEIDYLEKKGVKKPSGARPGFVIYHSNYSILVDAKLPAKPLED